MTHLMRVIAIVLTGAAASFAQTTVWNLDKTHSGVTFSVTYMLVTEVEGKFRDFDISLTTSGVDYPGASVSATIKTGSISTDNDRRDSHLRSDDFFNTERYPEITFESKTFEPVGETTYRITGQLTIRDVTREAVFEATHLGDLIAGKRNITGWRVSTKINRFDYNLKWNKAIETGGLVVGETVTITAHVAFNKQAS